MIILHVYEETRMPALTAFAHDDGIVEIRACDSRLRLAPEDKALAVFARLSLSCALQHRMKAKP